MANIKYFMTIACACMAHLVPILISYILVSARSDEVIGVTPQGDRH